MLAPIMYAGMTLMLLLSLTGGQDRLLLTGSQDRLSLIGSQDRKHLPGAGEQPAAHPAPSPLLALWDLTPAAPPAERTAHTSPVLLRSQTSKVKEVVL